MSNQVEQALDALKNLGTVDEMRELADSGYAPQQLPKVNSHIHLPPNFSAFETVQQAVDLAEAQQIGVVGVSNYYDYQVYGDFAQRASEAGVFPLFGLEIICMQEDLRDAGVKVNDPGNPGKTYLCGKGITRFNMLTQRGQQLLNTIRKNDRERMATMVERMRETLAERGLPTTVDEAHVIEMVVRRHQAPRETVYLQERHASQAFQEVLFEQIAGSERVEKLQELLAAETKAAGSDDAVTIQNDIRSHLMKAGKPAFVDESFLSFEDARQLVLEMGGIPCYPTLLDGTSPVCGFEEDREQLIKTLLKRGIHAAEWIVPRNSIAVVRDYATAMRKAGLIMTAGTEHNTLDVIPIEPQCKDGPLPDDLRELFWEGACVVAAHQFLTLHGECGYVDGAGEPNPAYTDAEDRITALARLGAAVIRKYHDKSGN